MTSKLDNFVAYYLKAQMPFDNGFGVYALLIGSNESLSVTVKEQHFPLAYKSLYL
ncbi:MAG: hypothetical protein Q9M28_05715 [Mariprofundaceae bacterium]|nr:hypothetical protein [Mariprofundaceae bacterium]